VSAVIQDVVIAGLDPAIQRAKRFFDSLMDARVKPAHDEVNSRRAP
jgi:hypothetical protein